jgi:hypothetical protein
MADILRVAEAAAESLAEVRLVVVAVVEIPAAAQRAAVAGETPVAQTRREELELENCFQSAGAGGLG